MADGGQRLLDVIDDPNALESFLGGLTADTELLPSAETVDNVVASLARSLDDHEYEVDSPNETLFDTLDSSSNHLTDISRSYVPSDYEQNDAFSNLEGFSNSSNLNRGNFSHQPEQQTSNSGCDQFIGSSNNSNNLINSVISAASSISNNTSVTDSNLKQIAASVSNCDPSKSTNFVQSGQIHLTHNSVSSASNCLNFNFSQDLQQQHQQQQQHQVQQHQLKHNVQVSASQNQVTSLSSLSVEGQLQQNVPSSSTNNLISVVGSSNQNGVVHTLTDTTSNFQQIASHQQSGHANAQHNQLVNTSINNSANVQVTSGTTSNSASNAIKNETNASNISGNHVTLSTTTNVVGSAAAAIQQSQQFITNTSSAAAVSQLVAGQTVSIPSMTVSASQLLGSSQAGLVAASAGQNILQQIQSAGTSQSYIAMEQPTAALIATGPGTFGTNVALVATGGTPTYAVLPTTPQFLTNAIIPQSHTIQTLTKAANGTYFQTTGTSQIVTTSNVNALQNVSSAVTTNASAASTNPVTSVSTSVESANSGTTVQQSGANTAVTDSVMTQIIQHSQQQLTNVSGSGTVAITPQQSFAIGNAAGIGQVVVSQVSNLSTMTAPQQTQLSGTIVVNQYGQPMLLPTASTTQAGALQLILRQQPTQHQVLTFQTPTGPATISAQATAHTTAGGKPIVRYVSQMPQVAQTSGYGLQQIQTANGPALIAVRYPQQATQTSQFSQIQTESIVNQSTAIQSQITAAGQTQLQQLANAQQQSVQIQLPQQQAQQILQQTQQQTQIQIQTGLAQTHLQAQQQQLPVQQAAAQQTLQIQTQQQQLSLQPQAQAQAQQVHHQQTGVETQTSAAQNQFGNVQNQTQQPTNQSQTQAQLPRDTEQQQVSVPDSSSEPPPPKKAKTKSKSSKKKVTLDLEQLLKQSGIMDEDLNDDMTFDFSFAMDPPSNGFPPSPQLPPAQIPVINTTETPKKSSSKKSKSNAKKTPAQPAPPPPPAVHQPPPPVVNISPSAKSSKKKSSPKKKNPPAPPPPATPPPPVLPPPPPLVTTPTSSKSKSSKKKTGGSGNANENQKPETPTPTTPKTGSSRKKDGPPKKISSLDTLLATIEAVAAAAGASCSSPVPSPSPVPTTPSKKPTPSPKNKKSKKNPATSVASAPTPAKSETLLPPPVSMPSSNPSPVTSNVTTSLSSSSLSFSQSQPVNSVSNNAIQSSISAATSLASSLNAMSSATRATGPNMSMANGSNTSVSTSQTQTGLTRVVQTIQLTPQNQQLLRNIQSQIQRLCALPKRNEAEQSALQKLVVLQQQVIATGIPVPNPAHLNNENTHGKSSQGVLMAPSPAVPVSAPPANNANVSSFSQHMPSVPLSSSYVPPSFTTQRPAIDEKKAEEQRMAALKAEEEKRARWKKEEFEMLLQRDQQYVVKPDYEVPFSNKKDAVERLMKYHIYRDRNDMNFEDFDAEFGNNAGILLDKFSVMLSKYRTLLLKESKKEVGCPERVMLERMFVGEEKIRLEQDRMLVEQGNVLELPPPPQSWVPKIREMVDKEMMEFEPQDPVVSQQVQSAVDSIIGCESEDTSSYMLEDGDKIEYDAFGVPINSSGYAGLSSASSADIDEAVRSILT